MAAISSSRRSFDGGAQPYSRSHSALKIRSARGREARQRLPYPISVFERSHRSHRIAGDYPFEPRTVDPDQLLAKKGQVPFDALSLCRFSALRQRRLAGSDQLFDELAARASSRVRGAKACVARGYRGGVWVLGFFWVFSSRPVWGGGAWRVWFMIKPPFVSGPGRAPPPPQAPPATPARAAATRGSELG